MILVPLRACEIDRIRLAKQIASNIERAAVHT